jgi:hypothetical protein
MTRHPPSKFAKTALWAPILIVPVAFFASLPWLEEQSDTVILGIAAAAATFVMGYGTFLSGRANRRLDEVEIAGQRFALTKGMTIGTFVAVAVMTLPATMNLMVNVANALAGGSPDKAVRLGVFIGFILVVLLQTLGSVAVSFWWGRRIRGPE